MARYIDVDALWKDVTSNIDYCADFLEIIERQPTVTINDLTEEIKVTNCNDSNDNGKDVIYRQDAIDALDKRFDSIPMEQTTEILLLRKDLRDLSSAQPNVHESAKDADYIDRAEAQTAIQFAARRYTVSHEAHGEGKVVWSDNLLSVTDAMDALREVPSAQPEIIRCKDCKHYQFADNRAFGMPVKMCEWFGFEDVDDDDFCSFAERRTDE